MAASAVTASSQPTCSVIVPVYNGASEIARCLDGLAMQTADAATFEIIIVDDGSTDQTAEVVQQWGERHPDVMLRVVRQANAGPASARNHGARVARGRLLFFTDADCIPSPGWIAAFLRVFERDDAPAAAMGAYLCRQSTPAALFAQLEFEERYARLRQRPTSDFAATYSAGFRRDIFLNAGGFETAMTRANNEDVEFSYRLSEGGHPIVFAPAATVLHEHDATWSGYLRTKIGRGYWRALVYRRHPGKAVSDSYTPQIVKAQIPLALLACIGLLATLLGRPRTLWLAAPFLATTLPMARVAWQIRSPALLWVPWGSWLRALAFGIGVARALLGSQRNLLALPRTIGATARDVQP